MGKLLSRRVNLFFLFCSILLLVLQTTMVNYCCSECFYVTGHMSADVSTEQTLSFQIRGTVNEFSYRYFHPTNYVYRTNIQEKSNFSLSFSVEPTRRQEGTDEFGNSYTDLTWRDISDTTLDITITQQATTKAILDPLSSTDPFPVIAGSVPVEAQTYLSATGLVQADDPLIKAKADELVSGCTYQFQAVEKIIKWIINNIQYGMNSAYDARSTLDQKKGVCENFSHLACALLRAEGISARYVSGVSLARSYSWSVGYTTYSSTWLTGSHAWIEVFYPELGWIPYDAQRDIHHIDVFRLKKAHGRDNNDLSGTSWSYLPPAPSITTSRSPYVIDIKNDILDMEPQSVTDEINDGNYALCLEMTPASRPVQSISPPVLNSLNSPTDQRVITVRGTAASGSSVEVFVNGQSVGTVMAASNGNFSLSGITLTKGSNQINVRASLGGLSSDLSTTETVIFQTNLSSINLWSNLPSDDNRQAGGFGSAFSGYGSSIGSYGSSWSGFGGFSSSAFSGYGSAGSYVNTSAFSGYGSSIGSYGNTFAGFSPMGSFGYSGAIFSSLPESSWY